MLEIVSFFVKNLGLGTSSNYLGNERIADIISIIRNKRHYTYTKGLRLKNY